MPVEFTRGRSVVEDALVLENRRLGQDYLLLRLKSPEIARLAYPGQFLQIQCSASPYDIPLLRRPFTFLHLWPEDGLFTVVYKVIGAGTRLMAAVQPGARLSLFGPLGNGFHLPEAPGPIGLVGRGLGIAPLFTLAQQALRSGRDVVGFLSARTAEGLIGQDDLKAMGATVYTGADDGAGMGSAALLNEVEGACLRHGVTTLYTCGSHRMMRLVADISRRHGLPGWVSMEEHMACGIGVCIGCVCKVKRPGDSAPVYQRACMEGPTFDVTTVVFD